MRFPSRERLNPTVARCSACGSRCRRRFASLEPKAWQFWAQNLVWAFAIVPLTRMGSWPLPWVLTLGVLVAHFTCKAEDRLYHAWWAWRHPMRCQGGGEPEPAHRAV